MPRNYTTQKKIDIEFGWLDNEELNEGGYEKVIVHGLTDVSMKANKPLPAGYRLVRSSNGKDVISIALLSDVTRQILYVVKCVIIPDLCLDKKPVTQVMVWRTSDVRYLDITSGLPELIFRNILLEEYTVVASDSFQTIEGRSFWVRQTGYAIQYGELVYRYDRITCELERIPDHATIRDNSSDLWGDDEGYENILVIISKNELNQ